MLLGLKNVAVVNEDIIAINNDLYVKSKRALRRLLKGLRKTGYEIDNLRKAKDRLEKRVTVREMKNKGYSLWFAHLPDIRRGKCKSCGSIISCKGIQSHGHTCECCGEVTYYEIIDGSTIRFEFLNDGYQGTMFSPQLNMRAKRWDIKEGYLYLYFEFLENGGLSVVSGEKAKKYLNENQEKWEMVEEDGIKLLKVRYPLKWSPTESAINPVDIFGHYFNSSIVKILNGTEYKEWDRLPIPEMINIYESWHWAPVKKTPDVYAKIMSACGQISDKGWYYQDGRTFFDNRVRDQMVKYIRHFTNLNAEAFLNEWPYFRKDGPGFIDDFAYWCHETPIVEDQPNMWNTITAVFDAAQGRRITPRAKEAAVKGLEDPGLKEIFGK